MNKKPGAVVFDYGDTLVQDETFTFDPLKGYARILQYTANPTGITAQEITDFTNVLSKEFDRLKADSMLEISFTSFLRMAFAQLGLSFNKSYDELAREFWYGSVSHRAADGIVEVLDCLKKERIKAGVLSNFSFSGDILEEDLANLGMANQFSFVISTADYGYRKPHRRIFEVAVKKCDIKPEDIWFVGDRLDYDVAGASEAGLFPVWYNRKGGINDSKYSCLEVKNWNEFQNILESICDEK